MWQTNHFEDDDADQWRDRAGREANRSVSAATIFGWKPTAGCGVAPGGNGWPSPTGWNRELGKRTSLRFLHGDGEGGLWAAVGDLGLIHVASGRHVPAADHARRIAQQHGPLCLQDRDGNTWTGYERGGLVQVRRRLFRAIGKNEGLGDSLINTVCEDAQGSVWIGTHSGMVGRYENGVCTNIVLRGPARTQDSCVVGRRARTGVDRRAGHRAVDVREAGTDCDSSPSEPQLQGYPRLLLPGRDGRLWVGTLWSIISVTDGKSHIRIHDAKRRADIRPRWRKRRTAPFGRERWMVFCCAGTANNLSRWNRRTGVRWDESGRCGRHPTAACGRERRRADCCTGYNGKFFRYTMKDGCLRTASSRFWATREGNLWLGTRAGIARIAAAALARFEARRIE